MPELRLQPNHKPIRDYYASLKQFSLLHQTHEGAVSAAFATLLDNCATQFNWKLVGQWDFKRRGRPSLRIDGALVDQWSLVQGYWEAKDIHDDLALETKKKIDKGYPTDNILFQRPDRAILYQNGRHILDESLTKPAALVDVLKEFFRYQPPAYEQWERAVEEFREKVPQLGQALLGLIDKERKENPLFVRAFGQFVDVCRRSLNPGLSEEAVEKMLAQHVLTERIFRKVFDNPDFVHRNAVAVEIERVVQALTQRTWNRDKFLSSLDRFYGAIEKTAATIEDFSEKQHFLNTVYEKFFQGFDAKTADTHGIVYTPQSIVKFMVRSVDEVLKRELGRSLADKDVHILDPFVGTGNFMLHVMRHIPKSRLRDKYAKELHANEVMLLPYYIASINIEHEYAELVGEYKPFEGLCLVDTFELAEPKQPSLFTEKNAERVERQRRAPIRVIIGNPPYNAWQADENDRNKNRKYPVIDDRIAKTYAKDSRATLVNSLSDPYVKAFRWATDRLGEEGVLAYVSNNGFLDGIATDAMRRELARDFSAIYHIDLKGNARTTAERRRKEGGNVFLDAIRVGVGITILVRRRDRDRTKARVFLYRVEDYAKAQTKLRRLEEFGDVRGVPWTECVPDERHTWLTEGLRDEFSSLVPIWAKKVAGEEEPRSLFALCSNGLKSNNDAYVFDFDPERLTERANAMVEAYNAELYRWRAAGQPDDVDSFIRVDERVLKWIHDTKQFLRRGISASFDGGQIAPAFYRPFVRQYVFYHKLFNNRLYQLPRIFPRGRAESNPAIVVTDKGSRSPFSVVAVNAIPELHFCASTDGYQLVPFYTYDEGGKNRRENITDWALTQFRKHYRDETITKWDIFHYVYGLLQHPEYRKRYEANLKRELPRIPLAKEFFGFARAGKKLVTLHVEYEEQKEWPLKWMEDPDLPLNLRVEKMKLSRDKEGIVYNDFLTLVGVPAEAYEYRLGNRSALEWVIDQYRVSTDRRSGITKDPNRLDDPEYIIRLLGKVIIVSVETVKIVKGLPPIDAGDLEP